MNNFRPYISGCDQISQILRCVFDKRAQCRFEKNFLVSEASCLCVRDVLWMQLTSRERQRFMLQLRGAWWRCAGHCCRGQVAGCSMRRPTAASLHWSSAGRGKHSGKSTVSGNIKKTLTNRTPLGTILFPSSFKYPVCLHFQFTFLS